MAGGEKRNAIIYINGVEVNNTLSSITNHAKKLRGEIQHLTVDTEAYNSKVKELQATNKIIATHKDNIAGVSKVWANIKSQITGAGAVLLAFLGGQALINGFNNMIQRLGALDDQLADIAKTTGLGNRELQQLDKELRTISTRTSRTELLDLAKEAGKLGYNSVADIKRFVEQADQINVALGEDLGDGAITEIGKLANIFKTEMKNIGSTLNEVAAEGIASEGWQVDYLSRLAGIAETARLSLPDLEGYGAALESMGQTSEVSGTALSQFFIQFISNTEEFGKTVGFAKGELTSLLNSEGTNAAFLAFLDKLKSGSTSTADLIHKLEDMGIDGARASNVLLTLANNTGEVSRQQGIANKAFQEGTSITEEFNRKQESFGATISRLQKWLAGVFLNNALANGVRNMVTWMTNLVSPVKTVNQQLENERLRLNELVLSLANHNTSQEMRKVVIEELKNSYPEFIKLVDIEKASTDELYVALNKLNAEYAKKIVIQRKGEEAANQAQKQADAIQRMLDAESKYAAAAAKVKDITGLMQRADETNRDFYERVAKEAALLDKNEDKRAYKARVALKQLELGMTGIIPAEKQLNEETKKYNSLLTEQQILQDKLLGKQNTSIPTDPGKKNEDGSTPISNLSDYNDKLDETAKKLKAIADKEDVRQQVFLALADDRTKAAAELDAFWEDLINNARIYGLETDALYDKWEEQYFALMKKIDAEEAAAKKVFSGDLSGGSQAQKAAVKAASDRREQINQETDATVKLREEREKYVESLVMAGAAAVSNAQTEKEAIHAVINSIREAIKQRILEAVAGAIAQALVSVPFPLNLVIGTAAGAGAQALFDKLVPQAADGGYRMDVVGMQTGRRYNAQVNQRFSGGYVTQPMLVGEHGAEYTVPNYLMQNPYTIRLVDQLEGIRTGRGTGTQGDKIDFTEVIGKMDEILKLMQEGKTNYVVMPDQTITEFNKRLRMLEILSLIPYR